MRPITPDRIKLLAKSQSVRSLTSSGFILKCVLAVNVLLAIYNFMCFSVPRSQSEPCIVVLNNSELKKAAESGLIRLGDVGYVFPQQKPQVSLQPGTPQMKGPTTPMPSAGGVVGRNRGDFVVLANYYEATGLESVDFNRSITYTTQATHEFLFPHLQELCDRWAGPLSVSVYAPGRDFDIALTKLSHLTQCSECVAKNVTFHLIYHKEHAPPSIPESLEAAAAGKPVDCGAVPEDSRNYRRDAKLTYPINVLRNVARQQAKTRYVLASDVELYPSEGIIPRFIQMIESNPPTTIGVYTLPIFEVEASLDVPRTKRELKKLYSAKKSIFFHRHVCDMCQNFPKRDKWISTPETDAAKFDVFATTKRRKDRSSWEPIYIGTNDEPLYAEGLTWEGKRDKMSQMFELCLRDYEFRVLNDAFLCHAPGIKHIDKKDLAWRSPFVQKNNAKYPSILAEIRERNRNGIKPSVCI